MTGGTRESGSSHPSESTQRAELGLNYIDKSQLQQSDAEASLMRLLRRETNYLHKKLDALPQIKMLLSDTVNDVSMRPFLTKVAQVYHVIEPTLLAAEARLLAEAKLDLSIEQRYQGRLPILIDYAAKPASSQNHLSCVSAAEYWGIRYVLDGSCHGARILDKKYERCGGLSKESRRYWAFTARQIQHWPLLMQQIESFRFCEKGSVHLIQSAAACYQLFIYYLARN